MGTVPSQSNPEEYSTKSQDLLDVGHYSIIREDGQGSPIYISLPSLQPLAAASVISPGASSCRIHTDEEKWHVNTPPSRHTGFQDPPNIPQRTNHFQCALCSTSGPGAPRDAFAKENHESTISSMCSFSTLFHQHVTTSAGTTTSSCPSCMHEEINIVQSRDHAYPDSYYHQLNTPRPHHRHYQSQGAFQEDCYFYYCIDDCTFINVDLLKDDEHHYSLLPLPTTSSDSLVISPVVTSAGVGQFPTWSVQESIAPLLPPRLPRRLLVGNSAFSKYLSDILEASVEVSHHNCNNMALGDLSQDPVYTELVKYWKENGGKLDMRDLFKNDPDRFKKFSLELELPDPDGGSPLLLDYSKNLINDEILKLLLNLAKSRKVEERRDEMYSAGKINTTEGRAVLHIALRAVPEDPAIELDGKNVIEDVTRVLSQMENFCNAIIEGKWVGYTGKKITDVVNIGIGGSDLGPCMVCEALTQYRVGPKAHFVSNVDESHLTDVLKDVNPETTLFIIASKTFTTQETISNAKSARKWFLDQAKDETAIAKHFVALSTNLPKVKEFGIETSFEFWDFVGGRYSLWSAIGLSIALQSGFANFRKMLDGARFIDKSFKSSPLEKNVPAILALLGVWYNSVLGWESHAILPYDQFLSKLPAYLQQADMESNGKSTTLSGSRITSYNTGPVIWGQAGTNGQHAFYQLLHQGTRNVPADFIGFVQKLESVPGISHHSILLANLIAQPEALMIGRIPPDSVAPELRPHKFFSGNRPTNMILAKKLTPFVLGALIAIYEHKIFVQGSIWNVNSFDQWGVELGKELAKAIEPELAGQSKGNHDGSTQGIIDFILKHTK